MGLVGCLSFFIFSTNINPFQNELMDTISVQNTNKN